MNLIIYGMIICGIIIMVTNIFRFHHTALGLLVFFLIGYIFVAILGNPDLVIAGILFGGSI